jgi:hypothetical protein
VPGASPARLTARAQPARASAIFASLSGWLLDALARPFPASHEVVAAYIMDLAVAGKKAGATTSSSVVHKEKGP